MQEQNANLKVVFTLSRPETGWFGYSRRIDKELVLQEIPDFKERVFFTCSPPHLVASMETLLAELNVDQTKIRKENFPDY
jgi:ferredoxin-NADP reductase